MPRITKLKTLNGQELLSWYDATGRYSVFDDARRELADIYDCSLSQIEEIETAGGEFYAVDGEPVAYLEWHYAPHPLDARSPGPVITLSAVH